MSKESALAVATAPIINSTAPNTETQAQPATETPEQLQSDKFAVFAKKEAALQREREEVKAERERLATVKKMAEDFESLRKTDPIAALKSLGFTDTEIYNYLAAQTPQELTPAEQAVKAAQEEVKKFKEEQVQQERVRQEAADRATIERFKSSISNTLEASKDKYEYAHFNKEVAADLAFSVVEETLKESGELISIEEALDLVESYYEDTDKAMNSLKKRQPQQRPSPEQEEPLRPQVNPRPSTPSKTLSNAVAPTAASQTVRKETREQKRERLMAVLRNGLKK